MVVDWICRWNCFPHPDDMIVTVYDKIWSGTDRDYIEWFCPRLRVHVESDGQVPENCPFFLEHLMATQMNKSNVE